MNIGVIGGTFDPIHKGHIAIAEAALYEYKLDCLWFMPAGDPYFKEGSGVSAPRVRYEMTRACVEAISPDFEVSDFEIRMQSRTYSSVTFSMLKQLHPDDNFFFIMGLDSLRNIDKWYQPEVLFANCTILCAARNDEISREYEILRIAYELRIKYAESLPDIRIIHTPIIDLSSTMIRNAVKDGKDISNYVTKEVEDYIREHNLYRKPTRKNSKKLHNHNM